VKKGILLTCLWWGLACADASASTIKFEGVGKVAVVEIRSNGFPSGVWAYAGELNWSWVGLPPSGFTSSWIYTYCVGADEYLLNQETVSVGSTSSLTMPGVTAAGSKVAWLLDTYARGIHVSGTGSDAAALQVAIWESLYDSDRNLLTGQFQLLNAWDPQVRTKAQAYLDALGASSYQGWTASWLDAPSNGGQDQITLAPVAEPASILLLASGMAAACIRRRRSRSSGGIQSNVRQTFLKADRTVDSL
jgi:hypothetical protein